MWMCVYLCVCPCVCLCVYVRMCAVCVCASSDNLLRDMCVSGVVSELHKPMSMPNTCPYADCVLVLVPVSHVCSSQLWKNVEKSVISEAMSLVGHLIKQKIDPHTRRIKQGFKKLVGTLRTHHFIADWCRCWLLFRGSMTVLSGRSDRCPCVFAAFSYPLNLCPLYPACVTLQVISSRISPNHPSPPGLSDPPTPRW